MDSITWKSLLLILIAGFLTLSCGDAPSEEGDPVSTSMEAVLSAQSDTLTHATGTGLNSSEEGGALEAVLRNLKWQTDSVNRSFSLDMGCASGTGEVSGSVSGALTTETEGGIIGDLDFDIVANGVWNSCAYPDDTSTGFDESSVTLGGTSTGTGSVNLYSGQLSMSLSMSADLDVSGSVSGNLLMNFSTVAVGPLPDDAGAEPDFDSCTVTGSVIGSVDGQAVQCKIFANCDDPESSDDGCTNL